NKRPAVSSPSTVTAPIMNASFIKGCKHYTGLSPFARTDPNAPRVFCTNNLNRHSHPPQVQTQHHLIEGCRRSTSLFCTNNRNKLSRHSHAPQAQPNH